MTEHMALWDAMKGVDPTFTKKITGKTYSGDSPNPTYVMRKLTEQLGPIGRDWGFNVVREQIVETKPHVVLTSADKGEIVFEKMHYVEIQFWQIIGNERRTFSACGGTQLLYMTKKGVWMADEDAPKKSLTDAYTKAASWLGVCADIFLGLYDDRYGGPEPDMSAPDKTKVPARQPKGGGNTSPW